MSRLRWEKSDTLAGFTVTAAVGAFAFSALALFGLPDADLHSPLHRAGIMDPFCGMTRAMWSLAKGDLASAWRYNPGSFVVAAFGAVFVTRAVIGLIAGRWVSVRLASRRVVWMIAIAGTAILWANQQANAELLMT